MILSLKVFPPVDHFLNSDPGHSFYMVVVLCKLNVFEDKGDSRGSPVYLSLVPKVNPGEFWSRIVIIVVCGRRNSTCCEMFFLNCFISNCFLCVSSFILRPHRNIPYQNKKSNFLCTVPFSSMKIRLNKELTEKVLFIKS